MNRASYYIAVILSQSASTAAGYDPLYEESFVLIGATSDEEALDKARAHTREATHEYENVCGDTLTWSATLVELRVSLVDRLEDGSEFYARFFRNRRAYEQLEFESFIKEEAEPEG